MKVKFNHKVGTTLGLVVYKEPRVGIELEYENTSSAAMVPYTYWKLTSDHSLRNKGVEYVSVPLTEDQIEPAVLEATKQAKAASCIPTVRCGLHVHVNVTHLTWEELFKFLTYATLLEPTLFKEFAKGREQSHFCVPTWSNTALVEMLYMDNQKLREGIQLPPGPRADRTRYLVGQQNPGGPKIPGAINMMMAPKYAAMNLSSLPKFGTVEFRQAPSSLNPEFIINWTRLLLSIQRAALTYNTPTDIIYDYDANGRFTLCEKANYLTTCVPDHLDQEDAADAAVLIAGHMPVNWKDLNWEVA